MGAGEWTPSSFYTFKRKFENEHLLWSQILQKVIAGCGQNILDSLSLTACQFMEEPGMAVQVRESIHPYENNTNFEVQFVCILYSL